MCLYIDTSKHKLGKNGIPLPLIMEEDRVVWKVIGYNNISTTRLFQYDENSLYSIDGLKVYRVEGAIHQPRIVYVVDRGYHAYTTRRTARGCRCLFLCDGKIVKFVIPKGAKYFVGMDGDIVSDQIRSLDLKHCR